MRPHARFKVSELYEASSIDALSFSPHDITVKHKQNNVSHYESTIEHQGGRKYTNADNEEDGAGLAKEVELNAASPRCCEANLPTCKSTCERKFERLKTRADDY